MPVFLWVLSMAGTFADTGAQYFLGVVLSNTTKETVLTLHLYTNDVTPTDASTAGTFTEASGGGYGSASIDPDESFIESVAITSSSAANPTNILATSHGLVTNDYITIANHSGASTNLNGTHQATRVDDDNFTIPVDLSSGSGGTGGTLSRGLQVASTGGVFGAVSEPVPFVFTGALDGSLAVRGYWLQANSTFLGAEKFGDTYTPTASGDILNVTIDLRMSKGTTS